MSIDKFIQSGERRKKRASEKDEQLDIEAPFVRYAKRNGCQALKLIILRKRGFPDRTVLCPGGCIFFVEFKRKGKKPNPLQKKVRAMLEELGFNYYVCDEPGQAEMILEELLYE